MYARNPDIGPGKVAYGDSQILYRPLSYDQEGETQNFFQLLDKQSLQVCIVYRNNKSQQLASFYCPQL